jgi:hypothetical protein
LGIQFLFLFFFPAVLGIEPSVFYHGTMSSPWVFCFVLKYWGLNLGPHTCRQALYHLYHSSSPFLFFLRRGLCVDHSALELAILLPQPPACWDYKCALPCQVWVLSLMMGSGNRDERKSLEVLHFSQGKI